MKELGCSVQLGRRKWGLIHSLDPSVDPMDVTGSVAYALSLNLY